jgi:hypothetical protein
MALSANHDATDGEVSASAMSMRSWLVATAIYLATAIVYFAMPIWRSFGESLLGTTLFGPDNVLNAGTLEWGYRASLSASLEVFNWPAGYPVTNTLAGTENLLGWQPFFAPARMLGLGVVASYNICVLLSLVISGLGANLFARRCGVDEHGAMFAGFAFAFAPLHIALSVQFQSLAICWLPLGLVAFERVMTERGVWNVVALAALVTITALASLYYGVFLVLVLALWYALGLATKRFEWSSRAIGRLAVAAGVTAVVLSPIIVQHARTSSMYGFDRSLEYAIERSMNVVDFFQMQRWLLVWRDTPLEQRYGYGAAFPGFVVLALVAASRRWRGQPWVKTILLAAFCVCAILSLGPRLKIFNYPTSYAVNVPLPGAMLSWIPGMRMPSRMLPVGLLFLSVLAGAGASVLMARRREWRGGIMAAVLALAALDAYPSPSFSTASVRLASPLASSDAYSYLANNPSTEAIVELPRADSTGFAMPVKSAYVYGSAGHMQRTVAYNLSVPLHAADSLQTLAGRLPEESARRQLVERGVARLVVHRRFSRADSAAALLARLDAAGYTALFRGRDATVYSLERVAAPGEP